MNTKPTEKGMLRGWRAFLATVLVASLALGMTPLAATEAHAATKTKSYVYDYVYGTYQGKYALGFKGKGPMGLKEVDVISATDGVRIKVKRSAFPGKSIEEFNEWALGVAHGKSGVIGVPSTTKGKLKYNAYTLAGKKVSKTNYSAAAHFASSSVKGGAGAALGVKSGKNFKVDVFSSAGKKIQSISGSVSDNSFYTEDVNGAVYANFFGQYYQIKKGKFVKSNAPSYGDDYDADMVANGVYLRYKTHPVYDEEGYETDWYEEYYLENAAGKRIATLPRNDLSYQIARGLGVYASDGQGVVSVYGKSGQLLSKVKCNLEWPSIYESMIPGVWILAGTTTSGDYSYVGAYDAFFNLISSDAERYTCAFDAGKVKGSNAYLVPTNVKIDDSALIYVDKNLKPMKIGAYSLTTNYYGSTVQHAFSAKRSVYVAKNSSGKFGVVDTKGNVLIPFSYSDFYDTGSGDYIMMKKGKGWQFVKVSHLASGKAVKGGVYTVGKLKYKVTSTAKKSAAVTVVGHAKGKKATGNVSIPSTVKIAGQKFKVTAVGSNAFKGASVSSVTLGKYVKTIGTGAFYGCKSLKAATLGTSMKTIGKNAFAGCKKLAKVTVKSKTLTSVGKSAFKGINKKAKFKVPKAKVKAYKKLLNSKAGIKRTMKVTK